MMVSDGANDKNKPFIINFPQVFYALSLTGMSSPSYSSLPSSNTVCLYMPLHSSFRTYCHTRTKTTDSSVLLTFAFVLYLQPEMLYPASPMVCCSRHLSTQCRPLARHNDHISIGPKEFSTLPPNRPLASVSGMAVTSKVDKSYFMKYVIKLS